MSESVTMYDCPADGCDYSGPVDSVCGHYSGRKDGDHIGHYETARAHLVDGDPLPEPDAGDGEQGDDGTEELPCGHETIRVADISEPRRVSCDVCGGTWRVEP